jgi:1-acyl-sn-glycerol-3-phosphate acyltransferase
MMASRLRIPVVPIRLSGVDQVWHRTSKAPRFSRAFRANAVKVRFGRPIHPGLRPYSTIAGEVEEAVRRL